MLSIFIAPPATPGHPNLSSLDRFIQWVRASCLPLPTQSDAIKILESLRWIKLNEKKIIQFIDNKVTYIPQLPASDQAKGVVRDHLGTSIHFNSYTTGRGKDAAKDLLGLVTTFESIFEQLTSKNNNLALLSFVAKCHYDQEVGCLEARVAAATEFAAHIEENKGICQIMDLLQLCQLLYFLNIDDPVYNFVMAEQFFSPHYGSQLFHEGQKVVLTQKLIFNMMETVLDYTPITETELTTAKTFKATHPKQWQTDIFQKLIQRAKCDLIDGQRIQFRFKNKEAAQQLCQWLKQIESLQMYEIKHCNIKEAVISKKLTYHFIRLEVLQFEVLTGKTIDPLSISGALSLPTDQEPYEALYQELMGACLNKNSDYAKALIQEALPDVLDSAIICSDSSGCSLLYLVSRKLNYTVLLDIINKASSEALSDAIVSIDSIYQSSTLTCVININQPIVWEILIDKVTAASLESILGHTDSRGYSPIYLATNMKNENLLNLLLNKISPDKIGSLAKIQYINSQTFFHVLTEKQSLGTLSTFLSKIPHEAAEQGLLIRDDYGNTPLHTANKNPDNAIFLKLATTFSSAILKQAILINNKLDQTISWLHAQINWATNIESVLPWFILTLRVSDKYPNWTSSMSFLNSKAIDTELQWVNSALSQSDIAGTPKERWLKMTQAIAYHFKVVLQANDPTSVLSVTLGNKELISLSHTNKLLLKDSIQTHGLATWTDLFNIEQYNYLSLQSSSLGLIINLLRKYNRLKLDAALFNINKELNDGNLAVKIFWGQKENVWPEYIRDLKEPWHRSAIRRPWKPTEVPTHKFHHLSGQVIPYQGKSIRPKEEHLTHAKKRSATLFSREMTTKPFAWEVPEELLVGVVHRINPNLNPQKYDRDKATVKALCLYSSRTYDRKWVGSKKEVTEYAEFMQGNNFTDLPTFKAKIALSTTQTNEILIEPSKESLLGIFMGRDTPAARAKAHQYQQYVLKELGKRLPIICYDPINKKLIESIDDFELPKKTEELLIEKESLLRQAVVNPQLNPIAIRLFKPFITYQGKLYTPEVATRLNQIDQQITQSKTYIFSS